MLITDTQFTHGRSPDVTPFGNLGLGTVLLHVKMR
jgi:hypothetical protein